ncbi:MAG: tetratricopeptide repeat protein [Crocosphaera sp.]
MKLIKLVNWGFLSLITVTILNGNLTLNAQTRNLPSQSSNSSQSSHKNIIPLALGIGSVGTIFIIPFIIKGLKKKQSVDPTMRYEKEFERYKEKAFNKPSKNNQYSQTNNDTSNLSQEKLEISTQETPTSNNNQPSQPSENLLTPIKPPSIYSKYDRDIDQLVKDILTSKKLISEGFIYKKVVKIIDPSTSEILETCLVQKITSKQYEKDKITETYTALSYNNPELKKAKLDREIRALKSIEKQFQKWKKDNHSSKLIEEVKSKLIESQEQDIITTFVEIIDPNLQEKLTNKELKELATSLKKDPESSASIKQIGEAIITGFDSYEQLQDYLMGWLYEGGNQLGIAEKSNGRQPWKFWLTKTNNMTLKYLFDLLQKDQSTMILGQDMAHLGVNVWVELIVSLKLLQKALITWFEKQPYSYQEGENSCSATFLTFACIWCELSNGIRQSTRINAAEKERLSKACLQITLQTIRIFSLQSYFPLYGGVIALFSPKSLQEALTYLDEPLTKVEEAQEKARFLTLLGYSRQLLRQYDQAIEFHQQALELSKYTEDKTCLIANLNHLSRINIHQRNFNQAISYSQQALVTAEEKGDGQGKTNALANLGYAKALLAQQLERPFDSEDYERAIENLQRGEKLAEKEKDIKSLAICQNSLGLVHLIMKQVTEAISCFQAGLLSAKRSGDLHLFGLNYYYLAETYYETEQLKETVTHGFIALCLLDSIGVSEAKTVASLLSIIQGKIEEKIWQKWLHDDRLDIASITNISHYDELMNLLNKYLPNN